MQKTHEKSIWFYIKNISQKLHYDTEQKLAGCDITSQQGKLLRIISDGLKKDHEVNRKYLQDAMYLRGPSVTSLLDGLEKKEYIWRGISKEDGRALDILVTAKGMELIDRVGSVFAEQEQQLLYGMKQEEIAAFRTLLEKSYQNMHM